MTLSVPFLRNLSSRISNVVVEPAGDHGGADVWSGSTVFAVPRPNADIDLISKRAKRRCGTATADETIDCVAPTGGLATALKLDCLKQSSV